MSLSKVSQKDQAQGYIVTGDIEREETFISIFLIPFFHRVYFLKQLEHIYEKDLDIYFSICFRVGWLGIG